MSDGVPDWGDAPNLEEQTSAYVVRGMRVFWKLIAVERPRILRAAGVLVIVELLGLSMPLVFKALVDDLPTVIHSGITAYVLLLVSAMLAAQTAALVLRRFVQEPIFLRGILRLENHWPVVAQEKLLALSGGYHERENTGRKMAKVNKGVEKLVGMLADIFWTLLPALVYVVLNGIIVLSLDWRLGLIFLAPLPLAIWINLRSYRSFHPVWVEWEKRKERSVGLFCQSIINVRTVQSFVSEGRETSAHREIRDGMAKLDIAASLRLQWWFFAMEMVLGLSFAVTVLIGLYFAYRGWSTLGAVAYITITGNATIRSFWSIVQVYTRMLRDLIAAERMQALLEETIEVANASPGTIPDARHGRLAFENISLRYAGKDERTFKDFSLAIEPGEMLAFVGKSGSGKSSLVALLLRAYDPTGGAVTLGGADIRTLDRDWYRRRFAYVPQDVEIFDGTIRQNVVYAAPGASEDLVTQAMRAACLDEVLGDTKQFPDGLLTQVGERGVKLSGGQRQRVGIARAYIALLSGAEVLVLDEATSSLDSESERVVQHFIEQLRRERAITIIAIAHRLSTIQEADRICVLDDGRIAEIGTHEQLLRQNGLYHRLVALQQLGELRE